VDPIGKRIRELRNKKKLTMRETSQGIGVPITTYREWEYGRAIRGNHLVKLAKFFEVSPEELAGQVKQSSLLEPQQHLDQALKHLEFLRVHLSKSK
jgi:transcriptional regulator with XRE-family HTH domain